MLGALRSASARVALERQASRTRAAAQPRARHHTALTAMRCADEMDMRSKFARTARPQALGARIAARRQRQANHAQAEEEDEEADNSMSMLPQGLHNAMSEMLRAFAQV